MKEARGERDNRGRAFRVRARLALGATLLFLTLMLPSPASAHGATVVQVDDDFGPYHIVAVTGPALSSNGVLLTVVLTDNASQDANPAPVTGAKVTANIGVSGVQNGSLNTSVPAETSRAAQGYYETTLAIPGSGDAKVTLQITSPRGPTTTSFTIKRAAAWVGWVTLGSIILFAGAVFVFVLAFAANSLRSRSKARNTPA